MRVALSGLTMAEYFRDEQHKDVLLFIDNIFRFVQAGSEISTLLGRMPSAVGYQPTLAEEMGVLQERITSTQNGSVTSGAGRIRTCRRLDGPGTGNDIYAFGRYNGFKQKDCRTGNLSCRRSLSFYVENFGAGYCGKKAL